MFNSHITKALLIFLTAMPAINSKWWYSGAEIKEGAYAASDYVANAVKNNPGRTKAAIAGIAALGGLAYYYKAQLKAFNARLRRTYIKILYGNNGLSKLSKEPLKNKEQLNNQKKPLVVTDLTPDEKQTWKNLVIKKHLNLHNRPENPNNFTEKDKNDLHQLRVKVALAHLHVGTQEKEILEEYQKTIRN
jgi:hypothetical protein